MFKNEQIFAWIFDYTVNIAIYLPPKHPFNVYSPCKSCKGYYWCSSVFPWGYGRGWLLYVYSSNFMEFAKIGVLVIPTLNLLPGWKLFFVVNSCQYDTILSSIERHPSSEIFTPYDSRRIQILHLITLFIILYRCSPGKKHSDLIRSD